MIPSFLVDLGSEQTELAAALQRATVQITGSGRKGGTGSGVIWNPAGLIITNAHVVTGSEAVVQLADGRSLPSEVVARNRSRDLVSLQVNATDLPAATIGDSDTLRVGELVLAVGNPLGFTRTLTTGIVHALGSARQWMS